MNNKEDFREKLSNVNMLSSILSGAMEYFQIGFNDSVRAEYPATSDMVYVLASFSNTVSKAVDKLETDFISYTK